MSILEEITKIVAGCTTLDKLYEMFDQEDISYAITLEDEHEEYWIQEILIVGADQTISLETRHDISSDIDEKDAVRCNIITQYSIKEEYHV